MQRRPILYHPREPARTPWSWLPDDVIGIIGQYVPRLRCVDKRCQRVIRRLCGRWTADDAETYLAVRQALFVGRMQIGSTQVDGVLELMAQKQFPWEAQYLLDVAKDKVKVSRDAIPFPWTTHRSWSDRRPEEYYHFEYRRAGGIAPMHIELPEEPGMHRAHKMLRFVMRARECSPAPP